MQQIIITTTEGNIYASPTGENALPIENNPVLTVILKDHEKISVNQKDADSLWVSDNQDGTIVEWVRGTVPALFTKEDRGIHEAFRRLALAADGEIQLESQAASK